MRFCCGGLVCLVIAGGVTAEPAQRWVAPRMEPIVHRGVDAAITQNPGGDLAVWVFLTDKGVSDDTGFRRTVDDVRRTSNTRTLARRAARGKRPESVQFDDLPISRDYEKRIVETGAHLRTRSRWLNAVSVNASAEQIRQLSELTFVRQIRPIAKSTFVDPPRTALPNRPQMPPSNQPPGPSSGPDFYGNASAQLNQINIPAVHNAGYTGAGIIIGILDTGFARTHEAFNEPGHPLDFIAEYDFINDDGNAGPEPGDPFSQHDHGTLILGTIGAYKPDVLVGGAYNASFVLAKTEDVSDETPVEEDYYVAGLEWIESHGADVATSSLGYIDWYTQSDLDGETAVTTVAVNIATANGLVCCTAAGNEGHDSDPATADLIAPADALDVLTVGAAGGDGVIASFSSDGPTADGRVKPEVLARGLGTATVNPDDDLAYQSASGTSLSTPLMACAAALVVQAHPDWSVAQVRSALIRTADGYVANGTFDAEYVRGYGIVDVMAAIQTSFAGDIDRDGKIDLIDYAAFQGCLAGPDQSAPPTCNDADIDADGDVDAADAVLMQTHFTGSISIGS